MNSTWVKHAISEINADYQRSADTHLIRLSLPGFDGIQLYLKDESTHPTGSLKHRLARSLFLYGLCNGWIKEGTPIIESSSGSTAVSEAYFARLLGLDGVILMAFLLGFPANEIVIPIIIMAYLSTGSLLEFDSLDALRQLLVDHGWTWLTAVCTMLFSLMHWPCSTTCLTIGKETKSAKWTLLSIAIPTGIGMAVCFLVASAARLLGLA